MEQYGPSANLPVESLDQPGQLATDLTELSPAVTLALPAGARVISDSEQWHVSYFRGKKTGYRQTHTREFESDHRRFRQTDILERRSILRFGEPVSLAIVVSQVVDDANRVVEFEYRVPLGAEVTHARGTVEGTDLRLEEHTPGKSVVRKSLPIPANAHGFTGLEDSLREKPLRAGERRSITVLQLPPWPMVGELGLTALEEEATSLPAGEQRLLRIDEKIPQPDGAPMLCHLWIDSQGRIVKQTLPVAQEEIYLATRGGRSKRRTRRRSIWGPTCSCAVAIARDAHLLTARSIGLGSRTARLGFP